MACKFVFPIMFNKEQYEVGDRVDIVPSKKHSKGYVMRLTGRAEVIAKYERFMLVEKSVTLGTIRECIPYSDIHAEYIKVVKC